ncbi:MFS transporter [Nonomuraea sp. H19]|uniref:MFS transporter n=1 Tax=Nonomuraea sp. H19 TaxID=3452206 RepID=UPI003F8CE1F6
MSPSQDSRSRRLPLVVWVLAAGTFLMSGTEFVVAGLLPEIADDLGVSVSQAGLLVTTFAAGMIIGPPAMAIATLRLPRRSTLVLALVVFALGHVVAALSSDFAVVLVSRVVTALATGAFWCLATVMAAIAAGPTATSRAMGLLMGGLTVANVVGVPLGSWLGQVSDWRAPFWVLAALSAGAAAVVGRFIPDEPRQQPPSVRAEFAALRQRRLWLVLGFIALLLGGVLATYSYISPLLTDRAGVPIGSVPLVLAAYGVGAVLGTAAGGRVGDDRPLATMIVSAGATTLILCLLVFFSTSPGVTVVLVILLGVTGFAATPVLGALVVRFAGSAPTLATSLGSAASNVGVTIGSWAAGIALASSLREAGPPLVGTVAAVLTAVPLTALALMHATRSETPSPQPGAAAGPPAQTRTRDRS